MFTHQVFKAFEKQVENQEETKKNGPLLLIFTW